MTATSQNRNTLVGFFEGEGEILSATRAARKAGYQIDDVYTPYAVHGMDEAMGMPQSRLSWVTFLAGLTGLVLMLTFEWWMTAVAWPLNVGGKPFFSLPAYIPVAFEFTVLCAGLASVAALFIAAKLYPGKQRAQLARVTNDRFALAVKLGGAADESSVRKLFEAQHAVEVSALDDSGVEVAS